MNSACRIKPRWLGLDPAANLWTGDENARTDVMQFVNLLASVSVEAATAVILATHPSLTGMSSGSGLSGSTGWNNGPRERLYLTSAVTMEGTEPDPDLRELKIMKSNYGPIGERVTLRWRNGVFVPEQLDGGSLEQMARNQNAEAVFLELLELFTAQGQNVNHTSGQIYAPAKFARHAKAKGYSSSILHQAMQRLLDKGRVRIVQIGRPSRPSFKLSIEPAPEPQEG